MNKATVIRFIIQTVSFPLGFSGILLFWLGCKLIIELEENDVFAWYFIIGFFVLAILSILVAWLNIRCFGPTSIRWSVGLVSFFMHSKLSRFLDPFIHDHMTNKVLVSNGTAVDYFIACACLILPIWFAVYFYKKVSQKLIEWIEINSSNQRVDPTVKTPVESGKAQGTAGHP